MNESALPELSSAPTSTVVRIGHRDGSAVLVLDPDSPFELLRAELRALLDQPDAASQDLHGQPLRLDLGGRELALFDLRRVVHLLRDEYDITVSGVSCTPRALHRFAEQELKLRILLREPEAEPARGAAAAPAACPGRASGRGQEAEAEPAPQADSSDAPTADAAATADAAPDTDAPAEGPKANDDSATETEDEAALPAATTPVAPLVAPRPEEAAAGPRTLSVHRTLRSGVRLRFPGDVIVYGDVNAGAQVEADGNIVVLGSLRGLAHAGARGDESAVIIGFDLRPNQVRIGDCIAFPPERSKPEAPRLLSLLQRDRPAGRSYSPEIAHIEEGAIVLEDYRGRLPGGGR